MEQLYMDFLGKASLILVAMIVSLINIRDAS